MLTMKVLFLLSLAMAKRFGELQAISCHVAFRGLDLVCLIFLSLWQRLSWSAILFLVKSLEDFVGDLPE